MMKYFFAILILFIIGSGTEATTYTVTHQVYFDVMIDDHPVGRVVIGLFGEVVPKTVENFVSIAVKGINGKTYAGSSFHRVIRKFMIQGGDIVNRDGTGSVSIYGQYFDNENFDIGHDGPGFVSMAHGGPNKNGCQFFITTIGTPWLDGQHTVFGKVVEGMDVVFKIEQTKTYSDDSPTVPIIIAESGLIPLEKSYTVSNDPHGLWDWIKATAVPLSFSFTILGIFHWMMKQLDAAAGI